MSARRFPDPVLRVRPPAPRGRKARRRLLLAGLIGGTARWRLLLAGLIGGTAPAFAASDAGDEGAADGAAPREGALGPGVRSESPPAGADAWLTACSPSFPLCVSAAPGTPPATAGPALLAAEHIWATLTGTLAAPAPEGPWGRRWRLYLVDGVDAGGRAAFVDRDPRGSFDRGWSFGLVDRRLVPGCGLDVAVARAIARGSLWRAAPATDEGSAIAEAEGLAHLTTACSPGPAEWSDLAAFQAHAERALIDPREPAFDRGAALFFRWLDARFGSEPGALIGGLWALAPTRTPDSAWAAGRWAGAPDGFDVVRASLAGALWKGSTLDDLLVRFSVDRATAIPAPPVVPSWDIPWPSTARRLSSGTPPAPTGASYVVVERAGAPAGSRLRIEAEWEDYARMRWTAVKLDAAGHATAEVAIRSLDRVPHASMTLDGLDGVARVLLVATHVGNTERAFDPDQPEWEPHGWLLTVAGE